MQQTSTVDQAKPRTFDDLYHHYSDWAYRLASLLTQDSTAGEEIVQEAFIRVHQNWETIDFPVAYLRRILVNHSSNWLRSQAVHRRKLPLLVSNTATQLNADELSDAIAKLDFRKRAVIVLRYYFGWSEAEIADALGCRPGTVKSTASRALAQLREDLEP